MNIKQRGKRDQIKDQVIAVAEKGRGDKGKGKHKIKIQICISQLFFFLN
jgi:hypothetical protein